jgi:hypothetical protein
MTTTIDTLSYVKRLETAGVDRKTAEAHAEALNTVVVPQLATKSDLKELGQEMRVEIWKAALAQTLAVLAIGGFLIRFMK